VRLIRGWNIRRKQRLLDRPAPTRLNNGLFLAAALARSMNVARMQLIATFVHLFISLPDFDDVELGQLEKILQAVSAMPDEDFRNTGASLKRMERITNELCS
jgi:hypothetical protein